MFTSAKDLIAKKVVVGERKDVRLDVTIEGSGRGVSVCRMWRR